MMGHSGKTSSTGWRLSRLLFHRFAKGVMTRVTGDTIALSPPLIISKEQIDEVAGTLDSVLRD